MIDIIQYQRKKLLRLIINMTKARYTFNTKEKDRVKLNKKAVELTALSGEAVTWSRVLNYLIENHLDDIDHDKFISEIKK